MSELATIVAALAMFAMVGALASLGGTTLVYLWGDSLRRQGRLFAAVCAGPFLLCALATLVIATADAWEAETLLAFAISIIPMLIVSWPIAYFTLRSLDRKRTIGTGIFE